MEQKIWKALEQVQDPEIPVITVIDLGIITGVSVENNKAIVKMTPTFTACPAIDVMKKEVLEATESVVGKGNAEVIVDFSVKWDSNMISEEGKQKLKAFGLAPPKKHKGEFDPEMLKKVTCPHCDSINTSLNSPFGSTLCRSIHFCYDCKQGYEAFKPIV